MYSVQVRKAEPLRVACIAHTGPYQELGPVYDRLEAWVKKKGTASGFVREIGYDNPMQTPPEKCRQEICVPIAKAVRPDDEVRIKTLPAAEIVAVVHRGGLDFESLGPAYRTLMEFAAKEGKQAQYSIITYYTPPQRRNDAEVEIALVVG